MSQVAGRAPAVPAAAERLHVVGDYLRDADHGCLFGDDAGPVESFRERTRDCQAPADEPVLEAEPQTQLFRQALQREVVAVVAVAMAQRVAAMALILRAWFRLERAGEAQPPRAQAQQGQKRQPKAQHQKHQG